MCKNDFEEIIEKTRRFIKTTKKNSPDIDLGTQGDWALEYASKLEPCTNEELEALDTQIRQMVKNFNI